MKKSTLIIGLAGATLTGVFLYKYSKEKGSEVNETVQGLSVNVNPERIVDGLVTMSGVDERYREGISTLGKIAVSRLGKSNLKN